MITTVLPSVGEKSCLTSGIEIAAKLAAGIAVPLGALGLNLHAWHLRSFGKLPAKV